MWGFPFRGRGVGGTPSLYSCLVLLPVSVQIGVPIFCILCYNAVMENGTPITTDTPRRGPGKPALPADQKQVKRTVSMTLPDWDYLALWSGGDPDMDTPSHHLRELVADMQRMRPRGPRVFGHEGKRPRHVMPGGKLARFASRAGDDLTNKEAAALIVQRYIAEHPEEFE